MSLAGLGDGWRAALALLLSSSALGCAVGCTAELGAPSAGEQSSTPQSSTPQSSTPQSSTPQSSTPQARSNRVQGAPRAEASEPPRVHPAGAEPERALPKSADVPARGWADLDPTNDFVVAPPEPIERCSERLSERGVTFRLAELPLVDGPRGAFQCGAHDAVVYSKGPTGMRLSPPAVMTCRMALALADVEELLQELALRELGKKVARASHVGTYSCRKMVRFDYVSEHSYGNAIDLGSFTLEDGRQVSVVRHFGPLDREPQEPRARFLRALGEQAFARDLVSVSLGPFWDAAHRDHFHLDMARYRVDGSRPRGRGGASRDRTALRRLVRLVRLARAR